MRFLPGASTAMLAILTLGSIAASGCAQVGELKARKQFKAANGAYQAQEYKRAAGLYEETIEAAPDSEQAHQAYFFLGNCYDNLWKPSKKGDADNDALLTKAVDNYQKAAEKLSVSPDPSDKKLGKLSLLLCQLGPDNFNGSLKRNVLVVSCLRFSCWRENGLRQSC